MSQIKAEFYDRDRVGVIKLLPNGEELLRISDVSLDQFKRLVAKYRASHAAPQRADIEFYTR
jgi:hypothetical protein